MNSFTFWLPYILIAIASAVYFYRQWEKSAAARKDDIAERIALRESITSLTAATHELRVVTVEEFSKINTVVNDANKFITGTRRACEAIAEATVQHMKTVKDFSALVAKEPDGDRYGDLESTADDRASRIGQDILTRILQGKNPSEARDLAEADEEERVAIGSVSFG